MKEEHKYKIGVLAVVALGLTFVVAGAGKLLAEYEPFVSLAFLPQPLVKVISMGLPYLEITIGGLLIFGIAVKVAASLSALLILGFMTSNMLLIYLGAGTKSCGGCFGVVGGFTAISALILDGIMAVMVLAIFACYQGSHFNIFPMVLRKERA